MSKLTNREQEVASLLAQGQRQIDIAKELVISRHTVYKHVQNIRGKTGARSAFDVAVNAARTLDDKNRSK